MTARPPPRAWIDPWPHGPASPEAPAAAAWLAALADSLTQTGIDVPSIAEAAGLDVRTVTGVLQGTRWPTFQTASALAAVTMDAHDLT